MTALPIPADLSGIDRDFVQQLLAQVHPAVAVASVEIVGETAGTATKARLAVQYTNRADAPEFVWLKAGYEPHSASLFKDGIYALEPRVYAELLPNLPVRAPRHHGAVYDEASGQGVVLLEDLGATVRINSPESTISVDEAAAMLDMFAQLHGVTSRPEWLEQRPWIQPVLHGFGDPASYLTYMAAPENIERFLRWPRSENYPPALCNPAVINRIFCEVFEWSKRVRRPCLVHGDAHVGNSYVDGSGLPGFLDWQCVRSGGWAFDVAYYLVSALSIEERRTHERDLLERYWARLLAAGGPEQDRAEAWEDYRTCLGYGFVAWLSNDPALQPESFNSIVSNRFAWAIADHGLA